MLKLMRQMLRLWRMTARIGGARALFGFLRTAPQQIQLFKRLVVEPRVPPFAKALLVGAAVFAVSPLNLPGWIPNLGALDEIGLFLFAFNIFMRFVPRDVLHEHRLAVGLPVSA